MNTNTFLSVMRWELTYHRSRLVKSLLICFSVIFLILMLFNWSSGDVGDMQETGHGIWVACMLVFLFFSGSFIFRGVRERQQRLDLLMVPAPMPAKFIARYLMATLMTILIFVVSFFAADVLQYLLMLVLNREKAGFVEYSILVDSYYGAGPTGRFGTDMLPALAAVVLVWWYHSLYLLGGVFFRKNGWLWTTLAQILFFNVVVFGLGYLVMALPDKLYPEGSYHVTFENVGTWAQVAYFMVMLGLTALNYWLSYRIFSRIQLINNKWTNI